MGRVLDMGIQADEENLKQFKAAIEYPLSSKELLRRHGRRLVVYGLTFFFANFGHNSTTFVLPAELFPMRVYLPHAECSIRETIGLVTGGDIQGGRQPEGDTYVRSVSQSDTGYKGVIGCHATSHGAT
ncbi:unnamed protein product [Fraxinus pennsylvanica]|uniref:Uncharacterized protein n=1 Tax=Fraxinus pennsylvanica TaxID=56036 RepID=A0AAD1ZR21_9LAMI|nr:unnamed protein product [Fraxinus pennsylvanica]